MVTEKELHICPMCDKMFDGKANARFCSPRCRKRASRQKVKGNRALNRTHYDIAVKQLYTLASLEAHNNLKSIALLALQLMDDTSKKKVWEMLKDYPFEH